MLRVYVCGPYTPQMPSAIEVLDNMRNGIRQCVRLVIHGYAPYCPWLDHHYFLQLFNGEKISCEQIQQVSMCWLEASDAVLVLPNYDHSLGTHAEIHRANEKEIPVFYNEEDLLRYNRKEAGVAERT